MAPARLPVEAQASAGTPKATACGGGDRDRAILERQGGVAGVVLDPQPVDAEDGRQAIRIDQRRRADGQRPRRRRVDGQQLDVPPDTGRAALDRRLE